MTVAAKNLRITIQVAPGTNVDEVYGFTPQQEGNSTIINVGDVFSKQLQTIFIRLKVPDHSDNEMYHTASVTYSYDDVTASKKQIREMVPLTIQYTDNKNKVTDNINPALIDKIQIMNSAKEMQNVRFPSVKLLLFCIQHRLCFISYSN